MKEEKKYLVCWCYEASESTQGDYYKVFIGSSSEENLREARKKYEKLLEEENLYSANICEIIDSTDY